MAAGDAPMWAGKPRPGTRSAALGDVVRTIAPELVRTGAYGDSLALPLDRTDDEGGSAMPDEHGHWTVEDHLDGAPPEHVELYRALEAVIHACGAVTVSPSKTTITFKGARRGFIGARPTRRGVQGYLDLTRSLVGDHRILSSSPYTGRLHVNQYRLTSLEDLDDTFVAWVQEGYRVGQGAHLQP